jgi:lysophospholipase L1-like esterase
MIKLLGQFLLILIITQTTDAQDWANLNKYKLENDTLGLPAANESRIVFMGNSITEGWSKFCPYFFEGRPYINRGISGQTTPQMLLRFRQDVINLKPKVVLILAGTNDIAGNTGPSTLEMIMDNIISMAEIAMASGIKVILSAVVPAFDYPWSPGLNPNEKIPQLNTMIKNYCIENEIIYLDYFSAMTDGNNGLKPELTYDGVHPNEAGYKVMEPLALEAISKALETKQLKSDNNIEKI